MSRFATEIIAWQRQHGRHDLPWQATRDPYAVWLSEIMLQQTQVATVIPYYKRFLERFPDVAALAAADEDEVLRLWSGLGYYSRARNLHKAAQAIVSQHGGRFPHQRAEIEALPGIGRSTAAAIAGFAFGARAAILDGNVKRVLARHFGIEGYPGERAVEQQLWSLAESILPEHEIAPYIQGLMDLGATLCTTRKPSCERCPVAMSCVAYATNRVDALPAARPRKATPQRQTTMLVLLHGGDVLLHKRPSVGIWGGLWAFPESDTVDDALRLAERLYVCRIGRSESLGPVRHSFTHFHLTIVPVLAHVKERLPRAAQPGVMWMSIADALEGGLPVPAKKILRALSVTMGRSRLPGASQQAALFEEAV